MEVQAVAKYVKRTPRKARLVADSVKGLKVGDALAYLEFSPKHAAIDVAKVIKSAAANAEHNFNLNREELVVKQLLIDEGPTMKRLRFRSRGMASQYFRPHLPHHGRRRGPAGGRGEAGPAPRDDHHHRQAGRPQGSRQASPEAGREVAREGGREASREGGREAG